MAELSNSESNIGEAYLIFRYNGKENIAEELQNMRRTTKTDSELELSLVKM